MLVLFFALLLAVGTAHAGQESPRVGERPPELDWTSVQGDTMSWDSLRAGHPLVAVFWATWCTVCKKDWPELIELADRYADSPLPPVWAAISLGEDASKVAKVAKERNLPGWIIVDPKEKNGDALGIEFVPLVYVIDANGKLVYNGPPKVGKLNKLLKDLTSDKGAPQ